MSLALICSVWIARTSCWVIVEKPEVPLPPAMIVTARMIAVGSTPKWLQ